MEIRIGLQQTARELEIETKLTAEQLRGTLEEAFEDGKLLQLSDSKDREYFIPVSKITYVEFGDAAARKVGFVR